MRQRLRIRKKGTSAKRAIRSRRPRLFMTKRNKRKRAAVSYNQGFDSGYNQAMKKLESMRMQLPASQPSNNNQQIDVTEEYKRGLYDGGDGIVDSILTDLEVLPDMTIRQIIEAGVESLRPHIHTLLSASEVEAHIEHAIQTRSSLSVVRLGDGELLTLAQEVVMNEQQVRKDGYFLSYAGVNIPDLVARDQLVNAIRKATIVGIPVLRLANFQPFAFQIFRAHGIDYRQLLLTSSTINYTLYLEGMLSRMLTNRRVLIVGNTAPELARVLSMSGIQVIGAVAPVNGIHDSPRVMNEVAAYDYDIALVGAGIPAVIIAEQIASDHGKVALDFGHLADSFIKGEAAL
jgi:hypothetical protein